MISFELRDISHGKDPRRFVWVEYGDMKAGEEMSQHLNAIVIVIVNDHMERHL